MLSQIKTKEIKSPTDIQNALILIKTLYPHLSEEKIINTIKEDSDTKYFIYEYKNEVVAYYSYTIKTNLSVGKSLYIEDVVVSKDFRRLGIAEKIVKDIEVIAKKNEVDRMDLICGIDRDSSHKFWERTGFEYSAKYFRKEL